MESRCMNTRLWQTALFVLNFSSTLFNEETSLILSWVTLFGNFLTQKWLHYYMWPSIYSKHIPLLSVSYIIKTT